MKQRLKTSIILPTYNESRSIGTLVRKISEILPDAEIIIVDDNSPDGTGRIADRLAESHKVKRIHRKRRLGLSTAVVRGFEAASGEIIGVMDADLSHPPEAIPRLLSPIEAGRADLVIGSRLIRGGKVERWPLRRKLISLVGTLMGRALSDTTDPMSGLFFLKRELVRDMRFTSRGYKILLEILVKRRHSCVLEVPYTFRDRKYGSSKLNIKEYLRFMRDWSGLLIYSLTRRE